jgi:zinc protease
VGVFTPTKNPDRSIIPAQPDLVALLKDYQGGKTVAEGESFAANYANIEQHTQRSELSTGIKLAYLPKETRGDRVNLDLTLRYGSEGDFQGRVDAAGFLGSMLMSGTTKMTKRQIQDRIDELKATVRIGGGGGGGRRGRMGGGGGATPGTLDVSVETTRENLPAVLALVTEILRQPAFPADEFDKMQKERLANIEQQMSEPMVLASNQLQRRLNPYPPENIRYVPTPEENAARLKAVKIEDVKAIYADLLGASAGEVAVVGDFDPAQVTPLLETMFKGWTSPRSFERIHNAYVAAKPETLAINTPDKANALYTVGMNIEIRDDDPDYPALFMANYILGGNSSSRLLNRIRQKEGLSYGVSSFLQVSSQDKVGTFGSGGICNPENAERSLACIKEELDRLLKEGVTQQELDDARKGYRQQIEVGLANDGAVAGMLGRSLYLGRTLKFQEEQLAKIEALKPADVQSALAKYVKPDQLVVVRAGDFEKRASAEPAAEAPPVGKTGG